MKEQPGLFLISVLAAWGTLLTACSSPPASQAALPPVSTQTVRSVLPATPSLAETPTLAFMPTPPGNWGTLLFTSNQEGDYEIYALNLEDGQPVQLTFNDEWDCCADWAPDGSRIVFASLRNENWDIYMLDLKNGQETRLTRENGIDTGPAWSPDGEKIAFQSSRAGKLDIYVMNTDGSQQSRLTGEGDNSAPDWSPDGTRIVYASVNYNNNPAANEELYIMNADGSGPVRLTNNDVQDLDPAWSPDGDWIACISTPSHQIDLYDPGIYAIRVAGGQVTQLTFDRTWEGSPAWSPDGSQIAYAACSPPGSITECSLSTMKSDGSGEKRIAKFKENTGSLAWSPRADIPLNPDCTAGWTQLAIGKYATVTGANDVPNRIRSEPSLASEIVAQVYPGTPLKVVEGPMCADGLIFWRVEHKSIPGGTGWTAEGDGEEYWLEPYTP